ncbi:hypothetical protein LDL08_08300 [Nonomuraea glycinis]|uniref:Uncharacterized protein n=1 Tax=Nonomuraea glycinis TaxID=2047744 RepID=A0A918E689_9ACTN|nr:hypothetical protein [Nonomuraea glycinis]MCA2176179.1 hypothetical protein [Nonomuraea glycinis]GGP07688.1 hypothetical protein GCM10012278_36470 [Nonomuraea glycinis]
MRGEIRDLEFVPWAGAIGRPAPDATAFVHRAPRFLLKQAVQVGFRATDERRREAHAWLRVCPHCPCRPGRQAGWRLRNGEK